MQTSEDEKQEKTITNNHELDDISQVHQEGNDPAMVHKLNSSTARLCRGGHRRSRIRLVGAEDETRCVHANIHCIYKRIRLWMVHDAVILE